jgi:hypothetical protein
MTVKAKCEMDIRFLDHPIITWFLQSIRDFYNQYVIFTINTWFLHVDLISLIDREINPKDTHSLTFRSFSHNPLLIQCHSWARSVVERWRISLSAAWSTVSNAVQPWFGQYAVAVPRRGAWNEYSAQIGGFFILTEPSKTAWKINVHKQKFVAINMIN